MLHNLRSYTFAIFWAIFVLIMCNLPLSDVGKEEGVFFEGFDKFVHLFFFFLLSVLLLHGKIKQQSSFEYCSSTLLTVILTTAILGGGIELLQWKIFTYRSAEWWDFFADMIGMGMSIFSYVFLHRSRVISTLHE